MKPISLWGILKDNTTGEFIDILYTEYPDTYSFKAQFLILNYKPNERPHEGISA